MVQSRAGVQMIEGFVIYKFNNGLSVSGWVGPELTHDQGPDPDLLYRLMDA